MKAIWKGTLQFGMITVPVRIGAATEDHDIHFHQLHSCGSRIQMKTFCGDEQVEITSDEIHKGYEYAPGKHTVFDADIDLPATATKGQIEIGEFVKIADIDPIYFDKTYYLEPQPGAIHAFGLVVEALRRTGKAGMTRVILRDREHIAVVREYNGTLAIETLHYADEVRQAEPVDSDIRGSEIRLAVSLVNAMSTTFDINRYKDDYREALLASLGQAVTAVAAPVKSDDLMATLKASIEQAREAKTKTA